MGNKDITEGRPSNWGSWDALEWAAYCNKLEAENQKEKEYNALLIKEKTVLKTQLQQREREIEELSQQLEKYVDYFNSKDQNQKELVEKVYDRWGNYIPSDLRKQFRKELTPKEDGK